jgi:hypothetical protein
MIELNFINDKCYFFALNQKLKQEYRGNNPASLGRP